MPSLGQTVLLWRLHRGLTQQALAARARIPRSNLSAIERDQQDVTVQTLRTVAAALEVRPGLLADGLLPPTDAPARRMSRAEMECIADEVVRGAPAQRGADRFLIEALRALLAPKARASPHRWTAPRWSNRKTDLAWVQLRARYPANVVNSLVSRITDRLHRP